MIRVLNFAVCRRKLEELKLNCFIFSILILISIPHFFNKSIYNIHCDILNQSKCTFYFFRTKMIIYFKLKIEEAIDSSLLNLHSILKHDETVRKFVFPMNIISAGLIHDHYLYTNFESHFNNLNA